jgi:hypothetical protein
LSNELAEVNPAGVPDWARKASTGASFGNVDASDLKPPRLKILAGQSPEIMDSVPGAAVGQFWLTIFNMNLGTSVVGSPILLRKSYQLWAPKGGTTDQKGPLATASDGIHWDVPNQSFDVKFPAAQGGGSYTWDTKRTVAENGLHKFGSSQPDNPKSKPAATLTFDILWMIDMPNGQRQLCVFTTARSGVTPTQNFISTTRAMGVDQFYQRYQIVAKKKNNGPTGDPYFSFEFQFVGIIQEREDGLRMKALYDQYVKSGFITDIEGGADDSPPPRPKEMDDDEIPF